MCKVIIVKLAAIDQYQLLTATGEFAIVLLAIKTVVAHRY